MIVETLDDFGGWGDMSPEVDFFAEEPVKKKEDIVEDAIDDKKVEDKVEVTEEDDLFKSTSTNDNTTADTKKEEVTELTDNVFVLNKLKEKGFIEYELEEGQELTEELAEELLEDKFDESVDNKVKELLSELPEEGKEMIQYLLKGGTVNDYLDYLGNDAGIDLEIDLEDENNQISTLTKLLRLEDKDEEDIETEIEFLKDSGKLKNAVEKRFGKYKTQIEDNKKEIYKEQQVAIENEKRNIKEAKNKVAEFVTNNAEVNGITFTKEDKRQLPSYMNDKNVKLTNGTFITQMQKELFYDLPKNQNTLIQLATLLKNRNTDGTFNFDSIVKSSTTKVTQEIKNNIRRVNTSIPNSSSKDNGNSIKKLSEYFN